MRPFINLFLYLALPITALSIILASGYFTMSYSVSNAIKLGTLLGFLIGISFSILMTITLLIMRKIRKNRIEFYREKDKIRKKHELESMDKQFILHMDNTKAYDLVLDSMNDLNIGKVNSVNLNKGEIIVETKKQNINIFVSKLTKETSNIAIHSFRYTEQIKHIINYIKTKEQLFMQNQ